jgi:hypothetical protein
MKTSEHESALSDGSTCAAVLCVAFNEWISYIKHIRCKQLIAHFVNMTNSVPFSVSLVTCLNLLD